MILFFSFYSFSSIFFFFFSYFFYFTLYWTKLQKFPLLFTSSDWLGQNAKAVLYQPDFGGAIKMATNIVYFQQDSLLATRTTPQREQLHNLLYWTDIFFHTHTHKIEKSSHTSATVFDRYRQFGMLSIGLIFVD